MSILVEPRSRGRGIFSLGIYSLTVSPFQPLCSGSAVADKVIPYGALVRQLSGGNGDDESRKEYDKCMSARLHMYGKIEGPEIAVPEYNIS